MKEIEELFIPYAEALEMKQLGFDEPCLGMYHICNTDELKDIYEIEYFFHEKSGNWNSGCPEIYAPTYSQTFKFFREKYDLHVQIRRENYHYKGKYEYFHYDISQGEKTDITKQENLHSIIMDECSQDISGNYLNNEKYSKLIFEKKFAFKTYEEIELECIKKLIKIVKK